MDTFVDVFLHVDRNQSGTITLKELEQYVDENQLDPVMISQWMNLFDPENTGQITLAKFCEELGLEQAKVKEKWPQNPQLEEEVQVILDQMPANNRSVLVQEARRLSKMITSEDRTSLTQQLKLFADEHFGGSWQVAIVQGAYWITFNHLPDNSFHFHMDGYSYLFWRCSDY
ncbi:Tegumental protein [Fasciola hepatica]|uniref:Tegumental protein n=1 Tax=Fasciola hepatica TaxID=6192 RepID=A0A2H1CKG8_FASHE|nr:Tegumental protein [Fasciola hepatica]